MRKKRLLLAQKVRPCQETDEDVALRLQIEAEEERLMMEQDRIEHDLERLRAWG